MKKWIDCDEYKYLEKILGKEKLAETILKGSKDHKIHMPPLGEYFDTWAAILLNFDSVYQSILDHFLGGKQTDKFEIRIPYATTALLTILFKKQEYVQKKVLLNTIKNNWYLVCGGLVGFFEEYRRSVRKVTLDVIKSRICSLTIHKILLVWDIEYVKCTPALNRILTNNTEKTRYLIDSIKAKKKKKMRSIKQTENEYFGRFEKGEELVQALENFCSENNIETGILTIFGAVQNSKIAFYDQEQKKYLVMQLDEPGEILHCTGNITLRDGKPMIHAHITLADREGKAYGGHLMAARVFAAEFYIKKFDKTVGRKLDSETNLALMDIE